MDDWQIKLFNKSVVKQKKFSFLRSFTGDYFEKECLDLGSDNGVISYLFRQYGGKWSSADIDDQAVYLIRDLVKKNVYKIQETATPFVDQNFDLVVIADLLEHINSDRKFLKEISRILKKEGTIIINVPNKKTFSLINFLRNLVGLTDAQHGHVRPGYTFKELKNMLPGYSIEKKATYSKFFTELVDILVSGFAQKFSKHSSSKKGTLVSKEDMQKYKKAFLAYSLVYPLMWFLSKLDLLLFFISGYKLIVRARKVKGE